MHIREELYVGSIRQGERTFKQNSQYGWAKKERTECEEKLDAARSKEQEHKTNPGYDLEVKYIAEFF